MFKYSQTKRAAFEALSFSEKVAAYMALDQSNCEVLLAAHAKLPDELQADVATRLSGNA